MWELVACGHVGVCACVVFVSVFVTVAARAGPQMSVTARARRTRQLALPLWAHWIRLSPPLFCRTSASSETCSRRQCSYFS